jgi:C1A family cysteine protease
MKQIFVILSIAVSLTANATSPKIQTLNRLIEKNHAGWIARETSVSNLSPSETKNLFGSLDIPEVSENFEDRSPLGNDALDWRNMNGTNWLGPVMNQGNCGSCVAFATVATFEAQFRITAGLPWLVPNFSTQQLFSCGGGACNYGWTPGAAASFLKSGGVVDAACSPYISGSNSEDVACKEITCNNRKERTYKIADYNTPSSMFGGNAAKVKAALKKGPLVTTMKVYDDFTSYGGGIYKSVSNKVEGGHAISIVGYNDQGRYWIIRNSWGADWGEQGFARISYDDKSGIAGSTWAFETKASTHYLEVKSPSNHTYVSGEQIVQVKSEAALQSQVIISGENESINMTLCENGSSTNCQSSLDTTKLRDGRYEVYAQHGTDKSLVNEFFILNHEPQATVSFVASKVDLKNPLVGRVEFDIDVKASPVMPAALRFVIEDMSGKIIAQRVTDTVLPQMKLGFRFNTVPNGQYKIYYVAETTYQGNLARSVSNVETVTTKN